jgi:hypothetical protein
MVDLTTDKVAITHRINGTAMAKTKVLASTFNTIQNKIASVVGAPSTLTYDLGYNLTVSSQPVTAHASKIYGHDANQLIQDAILAIQHQTSTTPNLTTFQPKQVITSGDLTAVSSAVDTAFNNRNTAGISQLSFINSNSYSNGSTWSSYNTHSVRLDWGSNAQFRGWANLGGFITFGIGLNGGSGNPQTTSWANLLATAGTIVFGAGAGLQENQTVNGTFPNGGLYNLLANGQGGPNAGIGFIMVDRDTSYTNNKFIIYIRPFGGSGVLNSTGIDIQISLLDGYTSPLKDIVDGTIAMSVNTYYAFGKSPNAIDLGSSIG